LTHRERQIMDLVCEGLSNKAIGRRLNTSEGTIKVHLHNIYQKLAIDNRTALAALACSLRLHTPDGRPFARAGQSRASMNVLRPLDPFSTD
jgi:DNA-binding CsgD family transcriptional regulator